jgi:hypothetical protein
MARNRNRISESLSDEDWRERSAHVGRQIAFLRELLAQVKIRAAEAKKQQEKHDARLKKVAELSADTHMKGFATF